MVGNWKSITRSWKKHKYVQTKELIEQPMGGSAKEENNKKQNKLTKQKPKNRKDKTISHTYQGKRKRDQIYKIRNQTEVTNYTTGIQRNQTIILQTTISQQIVDNLEEMNKFIKTYNLPRLNLKKKENPNRLTTSNESESVIKKLPTKESRRSEGITGKLYHMLKGKLIPTLLSNYSKNSRKRNFPNSFYETIKYMIRPKKYKKEYYRQQP